MAELVSIIIPTYNRAHLLGETLDSICELNYNNWECLVVDDGSSDGTIELIQRYIAKDKRFRYLQRPSVKPKGANACRNYGFEESKGSFVNFFDSDDLIYPEKLVLQLRDLEDRGKSFSVSQVTFFRERKENALNEWEGEIDANAPLPAYIKGQLSWFTPSILWRRYYLESLEHLFDEDLQASQEWEFHIRVLATNPEYCLNLKPLSYIRKHDENISYGASNFSREWNYFLARLKVYKNRDIESKEASVFLRKYLLDRFKDMLRKNNPNAFKAFKVYILPEGNMKAKAKIYGLFSLLSFRIVGKGDIFLNNVKLEK